jgi:hypothetical protein
VLPFTTSWLYQSLAKTYEGRQLLDRGMSLRDVAGRGSACVSSQERFHAQVQRTSPRAKLRRGLLALHHCQRGSCVSPAKNRIAAGAVPEQWFDGAPIPRAEDLEL